ncbi:MAG: adenosine kinase [Leptospirales bacterium]
MSYDVIGIGNALVDIQVQVEDELLTELEFLKGGMVLSELKQQRTLLGKLRGYSRNIASGGSAANTIHGLGAMGTKTYYIGKVANDEFGKHYTEDMAECSVGFPGPDADDHGTGTSVVLITPDAQRTMVTNLGISSELHSDNVDLTILDDAKIVYIEGYLWLGENTREAALKLAKEAKSRGILVAFTLSDAFVVNTARDAIVDFIQWHVDILFCNESEGNALAQSEDAKESISYIKAMVDTLFFTRGEEGAWALHQSEELAEVHSFKTVAVDTTGAGDLFAAGALYGMLHHKTMEECSILGCYLASQVVSHLGARLPSQFHKKVDKIIELYRSI